MPLAAVIAHRALLIAAAFAAPLLAAPLLGPSKAAAQVAVVTHHYDAARTGWNWREAALTWQSVADRGATTGFGLRRSIGLDAQVDAQPLVVPGAEIAGDPNPGDHDVVFVVTEANTVYAIDAQRGTVLNSRNLGPAVPYPLGCTNNAATVGINATPVIDPASQSLYVIAYTVSAAGPVHTLHRLALRDFSDAVPPQVVAARHPLDDGSSYGFNAAYQRQRAALLHHAGTVYAAFGSFCDFAADKSRGWLLAWHADTLAPLEAPGPPGTTVSLLADAEAHNADSYYMASIWMSGAGPAADEAGDVYVVTSNSSPSGIGVDSAARLTQSVVRFRPSTNQVIDWFRPADAAEMEQSDADFGAGGIVLLPPRVSSLPPRLAAAAGKDGRMFLLNRDSLGGFTGPDGPDRVVGQVPIGNCLCQPSYFESAGPKLVSSGGSSVIVWSVAAAEGAPLAPIASAEILSGQDSGFFTTISSLGERDPIIWAVGRPTEREHSTVRLYAFAAVPAAGSNTLTKLFEGPAGQWPNVTGNANLVPVVANGLVYVASDRQLSIFGIGGG